MRAAWLPVLVLLAATLPRTACAQRLNARSMAANQDVMAIYPRSGHLIGKSYLPAGTTLIAGGRINTGASVRDNANAQADAWPRVLSFLAMALQ